MAPRECVKPVAMSRAGPTLGLTPHSLLRVLDREIQKSWGPSLFALAVRAAGSQASAMSA